MKDPLQFDFLVDKENHCLTIRREFAAKRQLVWEILRQQHHQQGTTIILVTHNLLEAEKIVEQVAIMRRGKVIAQGRPGQLKLSLNQQLRLELIFDPAQPPTLPDSIQPYATSSGRCQLLIDHQAAKTYLDLIQNTPSIEDFRLSTATLEDLYSSVMTETL